MNPRLLALAGLAVCAVVLPLAVASAGPAGDGDDTRGATLVRQNERSGRDGQDEQDGGGTAAGGAVGGTAAGGDRVDARAPGGDRPGILEQAPDTATGLAPDTVTGRTPAVSDSPSSLTRIPTPTHTLGLGLATAARCGPELTSPDGIEAQTCVLTQGEDTWARTYYRNATGDALTAVLTLMGPGGRTVTLHCPVGGGDEPAECSTPRERTRGGLDHYSAVAEFADAAGTGPSLLRSGSNSGDPASG
ncbi:hypothetical protein AB0O01_27370 [Streptomyces sp. NPDC093252]|uniref:hypothetical protein n=1 Tax=Streptomyces sp. NPDC093252 TaxID=3154980 RepID=UPI00343A8374